MTPNVYIQKLRLEKAKEYLIDTDLSILMISQLVGYEQQLSPRAYRKKYREMAKKTSI